MLLAAVVLAASLSSPQPVCNVTQPNHNAPPAAVLAAAQIPPPALAQPSTLIGNGAIWTMLWPEGTVTFRKGGAGFIEPDGGLKMKFLWMLASDGPLSVSGRRLDGDAGPLRSELAAGFTGAHFQPSYLIFPTQGCWEVTAKANDSELTFVTKVVKTY
jgi:hypothetical protein